MHPRASVSTPAPFVRKRVLPAIAVTFALAGCAVGPTEPTPQPVAPKTWNAPLPHGGSTAALQQWWQQFDDAVLSQLIERAATDSPSLAQAWASIEKARATLASAEAAGLPGLGGSGSLARARQQSLPGQTTTVTTRAAGLDASWEIDLFGKAKRNAEAAQARIDARVSDWHDARVSLAAEVGDTYVQYRACGLLAGAYERELISTMATYGATAAAVQSGFVAPAESALARASVASTRSTLVSQRAQCELLVKSLVDLTGGEESALRALLAQGDAQVPQPSAFEVRSVPADVLRQRPDLAALERELAAASAEIGAVRADLYPSLSLSGAIGLSAVSGASSMTTWSFGPSLSIPLFDGGRRRAAVSSAQADHAAALARWRQGVRTTVKEVEQALVRLESSRLRADDAARAAGEYRRYFNSVEAQWRVGSESLLTLEEARRSALSAEISLLTLEQNRVQYWIALYKALGGGWQPGASALPPEQSNDTVQGGTP